MEVAQLDIPVRVFTTASGLFLKKGKLFDAGVGGCSIGSNERDLNQPSAVTNRDSGMGQWPIGFGGVALGALQCGLGAGSS